MRRLRDAAERIAETGEPSERVPEGGHDELAALGASFNTMLGALEESFATQRRFVADASHELRTPLTSLQTNIDVLRGDLELDPEQRRRLLDDLHRESQEMRALIAGLLELARGGAQVEKAEFQLDELVEDSVERARSRFPAVTWEADGLEPTIVEGYRDRMERAVWNMLENAGKWSGDGGSVEVSLTAGELAYATTGLGSPTRTGRSSSTVSTARPPPGRCPVPGSGSPLSARWPRRTEARLSRRMLGTEARSCGSA